MGKSWDKIFLVVCLVIFAAMAGYLGWSSSDLSDLLHGASSSDSKALHAPEALKPEVLAQQQQDWLQPHPWELTDKDHQMFVGRRTLYFPMEKTVKLYEDNLLIDGLPMSWIEKYKLSIADVSVGHRDPDGDGFSNLGEYKASTDPQDSSSHPPYVTILRVKQRTEKPYRITFQNKSLIDGEWQFQIATPDGSKRSRILKKGDLFDGFQITGFEEKTQPPVPPAFVTDVSQLSLLNQKSQESAVLTINKEQNIPEVSVAFVLLTPTLVAAPVSSRVGEEFSISVPLPDNKSVPLKFKLLKSTTDSTTVLDESSNANSVIPPFTDKEAGDVVPK